MDRKEFGSDVSKGASFTDWRKDGKVIFFMHPKSEIEKRTTVNLRRTTENKDGEEEIWSIRRFYDGDGDITNQILMWLKNDTPDLDLDTVIFRLTTAGGESEEYTKGDLIAAKGYDWRKNLLRPRTEYLFCIINATEKGDPPKGPEVLVIPFSAGKKLNKVWDGEIEELGKEDGDPWINPYACKVTYDSSERGTDMYGAGTVKRAVTEAVRDLFDEDPIDMSQYTDPDSAQDLDAGTSEDLLRTMCIVDCPLLGTDVKTEKPSEPKKKKEAKQVKKKVAKPKAKEEKEAPAEKPTPPSKPVTPIDVEDAEPGESYIYDDDEIEFVKWDKKKKIGIAKDEDSLKVKIRKGQELMPIVAGAGDDDSNDDDSNDDDSNDDDNDSDGDDESTKTSESKVIDCVKGASYFTQDGVTLTFVRYNATKKKGVFSDADGERIFLDGQDLVSGDESESDPLEPKARKETTKQTKPESKVDESKSDSDDTDGMEGCPAVGCGKMIAADATVCPHCGAEFEDDDGDPPF